MFIICYKYVKQKLYNMKEKIENRLKELYDEYKFLINSDLLWIKTNGGLSRRERVRQCENLINELEIILDKEKTIFN